MKRAEYELVIGQRNEAETRDVDIFFIFLYYLLIMGLRASRGG